MTDAAPLEPLSIPGLAVHGLVGLSRALEAQELLRSAGSCSHPIRLVGGRDVVERSTGLLLDSTSGHQVTVSCGNRRASVCAYCSTLYRFDAYNVVITGLRGGKATPAVVGSHPRLFVTVTAPSFGPVHLGPDKQGQARACRPRRDGSGCPLWHQAGDPLIGTPIDPESYDYTGHVLFNAMASKLWSATLTEVRRSLARALGVPRSRLGELARLSFAKVAEYQARGVVHFHAVARIDGPDGPASPPPACVSAEVLDQAVRDGVARASVRAAGRVFAWGPQLKVDPIRSAELDGPDQLTDTAVARYVAKYATKSAEAAGVELPPLACRSCAGRGRTSETLPDGSVLPVPCSGCRATGRVLDLDQWDLTDHARRLIETCWELGGQADLEELRLRQWAHMLGFRGHFATKSRTYSTTFGALRQERADFTARRDPSTWGDTADVIIINHWSFVGRDEGLRVPSRAPTSSAATREASP